MMAAKTTMPTMKAGSSWTGMEAVVETVVDMPFGGWEGVGGSDVTFWGWEGVEKPSKGRGGRWNGNGEGGEEGGMERGEEG